MSNTLNWYAGTSPSVAITAGTQTVIAVIIREGDDGSSATGATLNGVDGTLIGNTTYSGASESNITAVLFSTIPSAGNYTLQATGGFAGSQTVTYVYEFNDVLTASAFVSQDFGLSNTSPYVLNYSVASALNERLLVIAAAADENDIGAATKPTIPVELDEISDSMSLVRLQVATGVDSSVATDPEVYQFTFTDDALSGGNMGRMTAASFVLTTAANQDPQLDTPQADISIQEGQTGSIDCGANFSDANTGDTLTFSISPALPTGFSFNTSTGVISYDGSQVAAAAVSYTVTADDGNGGTPATDTFDITVTTPVITIGSVSTATPQAGSQITVNFSNAAGVITASCSAGALNIVSQNATSAVIDVPIPPEFGSKALNFQTDIDITINDGSNTASTTIQIQPETGYLYGQITTVDPDGAYANDTGIAVGQWVYAQVTSGNVTFDVATGLGGADAAGGTLRYTVYG